LNRKQLNVSFAISDFTNREMYVYLLNCQDIDEGEAKNLFYIS